jgi:hypothetical protein
MWADLSWARKLDACAESAEKEGADRRADSLRESVGQPEDLLPRLREKHRLACHPVNQHSFACLPLFSVTQPRFTCTCKAQFGKPTETWACIVY